MSGDKGGEADGPLDVDARFAAIVARFHDGEPSRPRVVDGSDEELTLDLRDDGPATAAPAPAPDAEPPAAPRAVDRQPSAEEDADRAEETARVEREIERAVHGADGGHFVPAEAPPLPRPALPGRLAWGAVLLGPLLLLLAAALWPGVPQWVVGAVVVGIVVGFGYLVWRLPRSRGHDDPDDGAIV